MHNNTLRKIACGILAAGSLAGSAMAANLAFDTGDLVLFFQEESGSNTLFVALGSSSASPSTSVEFRGAATGPDAPNKVSFQNIGSAMTTAFGSGWAARTDLYAGLAGVWGSSATNSTLTNGDPHRTLYVSSARNNVADIGTAGSEGKTVGTLTDMTGVASGILGMVALFESDGTTETYQLNKTTSLIDDRNPFSGPGVQDNAFGVFTNGIQQAGSAGSTSLGGINNVEFALDLYRIQARNNISGQVGFGEGTTNSNSFEGTVLLTSSGDVSFLTTAVPEPSTALLAGLAGVGAMLRRRRHN
jgi:hypothetical protein